MQAPSEKVMPRTSSGGSQAAVLNTRELFQGAQRIHIEHQGEIYRLQITRQGKLILTK